MTRIDYRMTDSIVDPEDTKQQFTEKLIRIPNCFLCYTPPPDYLDVCISLFISNYISVNFINIT